MQVEYVARYASFIVERREHVYTSNVTRRLATANRSRVCICVTKFRDAETPPLGMEAWLTPRNTPLSTCYIVKCGRFRLNGMSVVTKIRRKILTPSVPSFKVTQGHWN